MTSQLQGGSIICLFTLNLNELRYFAAGSSEKNGDRKRVPKVNITVRERALQVVRTVPLELVAQLPGMSTRCSLLSPSSHYVGMSDG